VWIILVAKTVAVIVQSLAVKLLLTVRLVIVIDNIIKVSIFSVSNSKKSPTIVLIILIELVESINSDIVVSLIVISFDLIQFVLYKSKYHDYLVE
jgi:hypothetical protein